MGMAELQCSAGFPGAAQQGEGQCCRAGAVASLRVLLSAPAGGCSLHIALSSALLVKSGREKAQGPKWSGGGIILWCKSLTMDF